MECPFLSLQIQSSRQSSAPRHDGDGNVDGGSGGDGDGDDGGDVCDDIVGEGGDGDGGTDLYFLRDKIKNSEGVCLLLLHAWKAQ